MENIKKYFNKDFYKTVGFYFTAASTILAFICGIVYAVSFKREFLIEYYSSAVVILPIVSLILTAAALAFKPTAAYAPVIGWIFSFASFLCFAGTSYMYLSGVFYNGVSAEAFALMDSAYLFVAVALLLSSILGNVALWLRQGGEAVEETTKEAAL